MTALWTILGKPTVVDLSHNNGTTVRGGKLIDLIDFSKLYADGVRLIIHKATQGSSFVDPVYASRQKAATAAGLKWDAYHFADASPIQSQINNFLGVVKPDKTFRLAADCEPNHGSTISFADADQLAADLDQKLGQQVWRYTGFGFLIPAARAATSHYRAGPLWWAKYGPQPTVAQLASVGVDYHNLMLWQETSTGQRPGVPGLVDESYWLGTLDQFKLYPALPILQAQV